VTGKIPSYKEVAKIQHTVYRTMKTSLHIQNSSESQRSCLTLSVFFWHYMYNIQQ